MQRSVGVLVVASLVILLCQPNACTEEQAGVVRVPPAKVAQLKRMEPLTQEKVKVLFEAGQLDDAQYILVLRCIGKDGKLNITPEHVGVPVQPTIDKAGLPRRTDGSLDVIAYLRQDDKRPLGTLSKADYDRVVALIKEFRSVGQAERTAIKRELRAAGPAVNPLISNAFTDPIDLIHKEDIWSGVANRKNPRAAGYIARTHQSAMNEASPVLIAYDKDVGGLIFRRKKGREQPLQMWYSSRELRELVLDLEKLISRCSGPRAATYLMELYAARYEPDTAPMRDKSRDRHRMVQACGGDKRRFDQDEPDKWGCSLSSIERALIGERLFPHLRSESGSVRQIAMNGLMIVLGVPDKKLKKKLDKAYKNWPEMERWWVKQRERILAGG